VAWYLCILVLQRSSEEDQLVGFYPKKSFVGKNSALEMPFEKKRGELS